MIASNDKLFELTRTLLFISLGDIKVLLESVYLAVYLF